MRNVNNKKCQCHKKKNECLIILEEYSEKYNFKIK